MGWLDRLRAARVPISLKGYVAVANACCALGTPMGAVRVLDMMAEAGLVPSASVYNTVFGAFCPSYSAGRRREREKEDEVDETVGWGVEGEGDDGVRDDSGVASGVNGLQLAAGDGDEDGDGEDASEWRRHPRAVELADRVLALLEEMKERRVPATGVTYAVVVAALLEAERVDDVLAMWQQVGGLRHPNEH